MISMEPLRFIPLQHLLVKKLSSRKYLLVVRSISSYYLKEAKRREYTLIMDLRSQEIEIGCPKCGFANTVKLGEVATGASIICVGCLITINIGDSDGSTRKAINDIADAFKRIGLK